MDLNAIRRAARTYAHLFHGPDERAVARRSEERWVQAATSTSTMDMVTKLVSLMQTKLMPFFLDLEAQLHKTGGDWRVIAEAYKGGYTAEPYAKMAENWKAWRAES